MPHCCLIGPCPEALNGPGVHCMPPCLVNIGGLLGVSGRACLVKAHGQAQLLPAPTCAPIGTASKAPTTAACARCRATPMHKASWLVVGPCVNSGPPWQANKNSSWKSNIGLKWVMGWWSLKPRRSRHGSHAFLGGGAWGPSPGGAKLGFVVVFVGPAGQHVGHGQGIP